MNKERLAESKREAKARPSRGSGAALGEKVLRLSSFNTLGLFINHALTLISAIVVAVFLGPADFGRYGLLLFAAGFLSFIFNLGSKQGTMKRTFGGGDDDDEDDDDDDDELAESRQRALATGLILTLIVSIIGTGIFVVFADAVSGFLLKGENDPQLIIWAGVAGGFGAIIRLGSLALWMEERPAAYIFVETLRPALTLAISVPFLAAGAGITAAIGGFAIGSAVTALVVLYLLRRSVELAFDPRESIAIMRRGARRIPLVTSMWVVGYMDLFLLSRFVDQDALGVYHLASKAGFAVAFLPAGYRKALRPLRKSPAFHAAEHEYGPGTARGIQLGYFLLMLVGVLLAITLFAHALGRISPEGYGKAAELIPLLSAGLVAPTVFRMFSKTAKFKNKSRYFIVGAVIAAMMFVGLCLVLIPDLGIWAPPIAMIVAFAAPAVAIVLKGQQGRSPAELPWRPFGIAVASATIIAAAYYLIDPPGAFLQIALPIVGLALWAVLLPLTGAIPKAHRQPLKQMVRGLFGRGRKRIEEEAVIGRLPPGERRAAKLTLADGTPLHRLAKKLERDEDELAAQLVGTLRRFADHAELPSAENTENDAVIGRFLFARATPADRGALGKEMMTTGMVDPGDLYELETITAELRAAPKEVWEARAGNGRGSGGNGRGGNGNRRRAGKAGSGSAASAS